MCRVSMTKCSTLTDGMFVTDNVALADKAVVTADLEAELPV